MERVETGAQSPQYERRIKLGSCNFKGDTNCLNVSYRLVLGKSLGTSKMVHFGVLIQRS